MKETEYLRKFSVERLFDLQFFAACDSENKDLIDPKMLYAINARWYAGKYGLTKEQVHKDVDIFNTIWEPRRYFLDCSSKELENMWLYLINKRHTKRWRGDEDDADSLVIWIILRLRGQNGDLYRGRERTIEPAEKVHGSLSANKKEEAEDDTDNIA